MRKTLVEQLIKQDDKDTYFLTADVGYGVLEPLREVMGDRFINVGLAEQAMIGIASGLALSGKKVYTYTMSAFLLRCIEHIRNDVCYQDVPVTIIGVGTGFDYGFLGTTHFAHEDQDIIGRLSNIEVITPKSKEELIEVIKKTKTAKTPQYIRVGYDYSNVRMDKYDKSGGNPDYFIKKYNVNNSSKKI